MIKWVRSLRGDGVICGLRSASKDQIMGNSGLGGYLSHVGTRFGCQPDNMQFKLIGVDVAGFGVMFSIIRAPSKLD